MDGQQGKSSASPPINGDAPASQIAIRTVAEISTMEDFIKNDSRGIVRSHLLRRRTPPQGNRNPHALVLRESMMPVGIGLTLELILAIALNQLLKSLFYEVSPADPFILATVDPTTTLRTE